MAGLERPRRSDVDFADVFGGPPRRSSGTSGHDSRRRSSMDSSSFGSSSRARSGPEERPVFGERTSSDRRSQLGEEFYKDIFPGGESVSPRRSGAAGGDRDVFGAPASPGSTSRPRSSFSMKFNGGMDNSVPTSPSQHTSNRNDDGVSYAYSIPTSPNSSMNSFLAQGAPPQDSGKNRFSWHRYPFLSRFRSQSGDKKETSQYVSSMDSECEGTPVSLDSCVANTNFHFSFYKWAGKGAFLVLPTTTQEKVGDIVRVRSFPQVVVQGIDLIDEEDNISTATGASKSQTDYEDYKSVKDGLFSTNSKPKEGGLPLVFDDYTHGDKAEEKETKRSIDNAKNNLSGASPNAKSSQSPSGDKSRGNRVKGKVKGFMKIFSPESSPKRKGAPEAQDKTSSGKNGNGGGAENKFSISSLEVDDDVRTANMSNQNVFSTAPSPMSEVQDRMETPVLTVDNEIQTRGDQILGRKEESIHDETKDKAGETTCREESRIEDFEECVVEHLSEDLVLRDREKEQMKISESKIREWSKGKEGNIRSLLSTLQYVLWPESGWKPVPLVDIIEGAGVKKAYQKALLCLHPDKLQQRGAAMHQKYIAEKVFEILQEAWKEFNSVSFG